MSWLFKENGKKGGETPHHHTHVWDEYMVKEGPVTVFLGNINLLKTKNNTVSKVDSLAKCNFFFSLSLEVCPHFIIKI